MTHEFELVEEITLDATPEQVWHAISTGPGVDSWFMGRSEFEPKLGGTNRFEMFGGVSESTTTAWDEGKHFAYRSAPAEDGTFMAFEYLIEGRAGGSTVLRFVHSGILGDDWEREYDGLTKGDRMYLLKLASYLHNFTGQTSTFNTFLVGPVVEDRDEIWAGYASAFSAEPSLAPGDKVRVAVPGLPADEGIVDFADRPHYLGVRTAEGLYSLIRGYNDMVFVEYHAFGGDLDQETLEGAWQAWIADRF